ncbi:MAG: RlmE family RNA methyltransferase [Methanobacteriota archaeon]|nr:MAG: RlmE family RNA methyltransferase [Euryarchaeota archaeon]
MGKAWVKARRRDPYYRAAKAQGLRSRAVFKLVQIQERFGLIYAGDTILDLGAAPGGWSRAAAELVGPRGRVVAVDRVRLAPMDGVTFVHGDFTDADTQAAIFEALRTPADVVICDAAPKLSGHRSLDVARTLDLARAALGLARRALRPGGRFVTKVFQGDGYRTFLSEVREDFDAVKGYVPPATSKGSAETYVVGLDRTA